MTELKYLYIAYNCFSQILNHTPTMTGCYQWQRVFNGKAADLKDFPTERSALQAELEKHDVIMINADPADLNLVYELRWALGNSSSTKLVLNQDHQPELWEHAIDSIPMFRQAMLHADHVFATTPTGQMLMQNVVGDERKVWLSPHPCETHALKRIRSVNFNDHLLVFWHRYKGGETLVPYIVAKDLYPEVSLCGYMENEDHFARRTRCTHKRIISMLPYIDFVKMMKEAKFGYEPFDSYSPGRNTQDSACVGLPVVGNKKIFSMQINYPFTNCDPYDANTIRKMFEKLQQPGFYNEVKSIAEFNVEYFGHEACRNRFLAMLEGDKPQVQPTQTEIKRGEITI
jgi:hypothetical protein